MLGLRQFICFWFVHAFLCTGLINAHVRIPQVPYVHRADNSVLHEFLDLKDRMINETDLNAMVDHLKQLKILCETRNLEFPNLTVFLTSIRESLAQGSLEIDDATFDWLYDEFWAFEDSDGFYWDPIKHKHRHKKHKSDEVRVSTKTALGFLKFMGGTLMCIIPFPLVQGAGAALAVVGISDMVDGCKDHKSGSGDAEEKMHALRPIPTQ